MRTESRIGTCTEVGKDVPNWPDVPGCEQDGVHSWNNIFQPKKGSGLLRKCTSEQLQYHCDGNIEIPALWTQGTVNPDSGRQNMASADRRMKNALRDMDVFSGGLNGVTGSWFSFFEICISIC
jgi:hypothetical protein